MIDNVDYIINSSTSFFNIREDDKWRNDDKLLYFLKNGECPSLLVRKNKENLLFETEIVQVDQGSRDSTWLVFFKQIDKEDGTRLNVTTVRDGAALSLYYALQSVYRPLLQKDEWCGDLLNLISGLLAGLKSMVISSGDQAVYMTVQDELEYWSALTTRAKTSKDRERAESFREVLETLVHYIITLDCVGLLEAEDVLENCQNTLDDLWRLSARYPQTRMERLMDVIGHALVVSCQSRLSSVQLWETKDPTEMLQNAARLTSKWSEICDSLTKLFWANYSVHAWIGSPHKIKYCDLFASRLEQILRVREEFSQMSKCLPENENHNFDTNLMNQTFQDIKSLQVDAYTETQWKAAVKKFEMSLIPLEEIISEKIKTELILAKDNATHMLHIFSTMTTVIRREGVKIALRPEREIFCSSLLGLLESFGMQISNPATVDDDDMPFLLINLHSCKRIEKQVSEIQRINDAVLDDLKGHDGLNTLATDLLKEINRVKDDLFQSWVEDTQRAIKSKEITVDEDRPVVEFDGGKLMRVTYSPGLDTLARQVRGLTVLGFHVPTAIHQVIEIANKHMAYARALQQVANFHNTIGDRMVASQRPMMLNSALQLSKLVQDHKVVSWNDSSVKPYIEELYSAVQRLSKENNLLTGYHNQIRIKVLELMDADLLRHHSQWKESVKFIKEIMTKVESQGFTNLRAWRSHWDHQLYKTLEVQYQKGIENLNHYLPEITVDLVFRQQQLQYIPQMEEIRMKYFGQIRKFLSIPLSFKGVAEAGESTIYPVMVERNSHRSAKLFTEAETTLHKLEEFKNSWNSWVALGCVDLDGLCSIHLSTWEDWDREFRACKAFSQSVAKLTNSEEKVQCFRINMSMLRTNIEAHSRLYWDALSSSLRASILQDIAVLETFVKDSLQILLQTTGTSKDIKESISRHENIVKTAPEMEKLLGSVQHKNMTLASWCKERVDAISQLVSSWERLQGLLKNHQQILEKQVEGIKTVVMSQIENLKEEMEKFWIRWQQTASQFEQNVSLDEMEKYLVNLKDKSMHWNTLLEQKQSMLSDCERFTIEPPDLSFADEVESNMKKQQNMWAMFEEFKEEQNTLASEEWLVFRKKSYKLNDFISSWLTRFSSSEFDAITLRLNRVIEQYQEMLPVVPHLHGESFSSSHWAQVLNLLEIPFKPLEKLIVGDFLDVSAKVSSSSIEIQNIARQANAEQVVRGALEELEQWGLSARLVLGVHIASKGSTVNIIKDYQDVLSKIGDNLCLLQSVKSSTNFEAFSDPSQIWEKRLEDLDQYLTNLNQIQRKWVYLEPIFGAGTLKTEEGRFNRLDRTFQYIMESVSKDTRVVALCRIPNVSALLTDLMEQLTLCQNSLNDFLSEKRNIFPRFFFLGDEELLEIMGQSRADNIIQRHLKKLFAGIHSVVITGQDESRQITSIKSRENEIVELQNGVNIAKPVEDWLNDLVVAMRSTLKNLLVRCVQTGSTGSSALDFPTQIVCLAECISFTARCEKAITDRSLATLLTALKTQLTLFTNATLDLDGADSGSDTQLLRLKLKALLVEHIHHISIVETLIARNISSIQEWDWTQQLRFYLNKDGQAVIKMVNAEFLYSYEYFGNISRLVHTSLTSKCYLTLTQAMNLGLGGNPVGPAGTGKTECVKSLGAILGRQVLVFNCDEGIDATAMARILTGLARCGSWGCFDEFNRLQEATLSAVSMLLQPLQAGIKNKDSKVTLQGEEVSLDPNCGIFVTLNPVGSQYGGRNRLPANLQALFRPVVMAQPHSNEIARVMLFTEGFKSASLIGDRMVELFSLASKLLSNEQHYDWGLRALKTVLNSCGTCLTAARKTSSEITDAKELEIVVEAVRVNTLSKLTFGDSSKFDVLVKDVFPGVSFITRALNTLEETLKQACGDLNLQVTERQVLKWACELLLMRKCMELYEQLQQRMGVVLVGPPGSGKTTIIHLLQHALGLMHRKVKRHVLSPKGLPRHWLLGHTDPDTRQWTDGVITKTALAVRNDSEDIMSWIICDGDIDPDWIESLNSVLDDNRLLTLPSGWRIQFGNNVNFLFETHELVHASPATISRMGIIYLSAHDLEEKPIIKSWLSELPESQVHLLKGFLEKYLKIALDWIEQHGATFIKSSRTGLVRSALSTLSTVANKIHFAMALIQGLGGILETNSREDFVRKVFEWTGEFLPDSAKPLLCFYNTKNSNIDIYSIDFPRDFNIKPEKTLPLILTANTKKSINCISQWIQQEDVQPVLLVGPPGCGKRLILQHILATQDGTDLAMIHCNAHISVQHVLDVLEQHCLVVTGSRGKEYRPRGRKLVVYFKDLDLSFCDERGSSMVVQLLIQIISYGGFYDAKLDWVNLIDIQIITSIVEHPVTSLSPRLTSIVRVYTLSYPNKEDLKVIYSQYIGAVLKTILPKHPFWGKESNVEKLTLTMLTLFEEVKGTFNPMQHAHYIFTPRDLTHWVSSFLRYNTDQQDVNDPKWLLQIFIYEAMVLRDRLVGSQHKDLFDQISTRVMSSQWTDSVFPGSGVYANIDTMHGLAGNRTVYKLSWMKTEDWKIIVNKGITQFSRDNVTLEIVISPELVYSIASIHRGLLQPGSHLIALGAGGSGRKSSIRIASTIQSVKLIAPIMGKTYGIKEFQSDLKAAMQTAALDGHSVWFLVEHHAINIPGVLGLLGALIGSGEVPRLFGEELSSLAAPLKDLLTGQPDEPSTPVEMFTHLVKSNLHIVLCIDSTHPDLNELFKNNPVLYKNCTIKYMNEWSEETLREMPRLFLDRLAASTEATLKLPEIKLPSMFIDLHKLTGPLATPRRLVKYVQTYYNLVSSKTNQNTQKQNKLQAGVDKLTAARSVVAALEGDAAVQDANLTEKRQQAAQALDMISATMRSATTHRGEMLKLREETEKENVLLVERKKAIEVELVEVEPLLQAARAAVGDIKTEALSEIRSLRAPPEVIRDILEGVLRLMGILDTSWNSMKSFLAKRGIKEDIKSFDATRITPESRQSVEKLLRNKGGSFSPRASQRASAAAAPLAAWVTANVRYSHVLEKIRPLEKEQKQLMQNLKLAEDQISELSSGLLNVDDRVAELTGQLNQYTQEAAQIELRLQAAQTTLKAAQDLIGKLHDEYLRWQSQLTLQSRDLEQLPLQAMLAAASISYLPSETEEHRTHLLEQWLGLNNINGTIDFSLIKFLSSEHELLKLNSEGLPSDTLSIENAIYILQCVDVPLVLDPSGFAVGWLSNHYIAAGRSIDIIPQSSNKLQNTLQLAIRFGKILIITEVDTIDGVLYPIIRKETLTQGSRKLIQVGNNVVDLHTDFRLILVSREFKNKTSGVITLVDFNTTRNGLAGQLLQHALKQERPELDQRQKELCLKEESLQEQLIALNDRLLETLAESHGDILQNQDLLQSLNAAKSSSIEIDTALSESQQIRAEIDAQCKVFRPACEVASDIFFAVQQLSLCNVMCQFSVNAFTRIFLKAIKTQNNENVSDAYIRKRLVQLTYNHVSRGVFKSDHLMVALHLARRIYTDQIPPNEWDIFTGQNILKDNARSSSEELPHWLSKQQISEISIIQNSSASFFSQLNITNETLWSNFMSSQTCETAVPVNVTDFQAMLVVRALRPDRLHSAMTKCVLNILDLTSLSPPATTLRQVWSESISSEPILLMASLGTDPSKELQELAIATVGEHNYVEISMGEGQETLALKTIMMSSSNGHWVCLKNVHLVTSWLGILDEHIHALEPHADFRLWMSTEYHPKFPTVLAKNCLKLSYEAPQGVQNNILRTLNTWGPANFTKGIPTGRSVVYVALAFLHAILQERRTFIPQGWSKSYEFSESDLWAARYLIVNCIQGGRPDWLTLRGLCQVLAYGGKIDNEQDSRILESYLEQFFNNSLLSKQWRPLNLTIQLPVADNFKDYMSCILSLPNVDDPETFGLPPNIHRTWELNASSAVISQLNGLQSASTAVSLDFAEWHRNLSPILGLWKRLNQKSQLLQTQTVESSSESPIDIFLSKENNFAITLVQMIHVDMLFLSRAIRGSITATKETLHVAHCLMKNQVPDSWNRLWPGPESPAEYLKAVVIRGDNAISSATKSDMLNKVITMSLLYYPETFLSALKQYTSRKTGVPLEELELTCTWSGKPLEGAQCCVTLQGLQIEGGQFRDTTLEACSINSASYSSAPQCIAAWVARKKIDIDTCLLPLYDWSDRKTLLAMLPVNSMEKPSYWVHAGAAFYVSR